MLEFFTKKKKPKADKDKDQGEEEAAGPKPDVPKINTDGDEPLEGRVPPPKRKAVPQPSAASPVAGGAHDHDHGAVDGSQTPAEPVLNPEDEAFLQSLLAAEDGDPPPLPPRIPRDQDWPSDVEGASVVDKPLEDDGTSGVKHDDKKPEDESAKKDKGKDKGKGKEKDEKKEKKHNRLSLLFTRSKKNEDGLKPEDTVSPTEGEKEKKDLSRVLDRLNLSAKNNTVVSMSNDTSEALQRFTQVFKDLVNGVPTAYDDLTRLIEDRDGALSKGFEKLPSSLQKLVTQLPERLTSSIAPELLAAAAASQGLKDGEGGATFDPKTTAEKVFLAKKVMELVTKPGAIVTMLRAIVETLKTRWPAFIGMNVIWSVALTLLMLMLWYCHKRGREVRLEREQSENVVDGADRIEELPDDPALPAPKPAAAGSSSSSPASPTSPSAAAAAGSRPDGPAVDLPHPPVGSDAPSESRRP